MRHFSSKGQSSIEYVILITLIALLAIVLVRQFGNQEKQQFAGMTRSLSGKTEAPGTPPAPQPAEEAPVSSGMNIYEGEAPSPASTANQPQVSASPAPAVLPSPEPAVSENIIQEVSSSSDESSSSSGSSPDSSSTPQDSSSANATEPSPGTPSNPTASSESASSSQPAETAPQAPAPVLVPSTPPASGENSSLTGSSTTSGSSGSSEVSSMFGENLFGGPLGGAYFSISHAPHPLFDGLGENNARNLLSQSRDERGFRIKETVITQEGNKLKGYMILEGGNKSIPNNYEYIKIKQPFTIEITGDFQEKPSGNDKYREASALFIPGKTEYLEISKSSNYYSYYFDEIEKLRTSNQSLMTNPVQTNILVGEKGSAGMAQPGNVTFRIGNECILQNYQMGVHSDYFDKNLTLDQIFQNMGDLTFDPFEDGTAGTFGFDLKDGKKTTVKNSHFERIGNKISGWMDIECSGYCSGRQYFEGEIVGQIRQDQSADYPYLKSKFDTRTVVNFTGTRMDYQYTSDAFNKLMPEKPSTLIEKIPSACFWLSEKNGSVDVSYLQGQISPEYLGSGVNAEFFSSFFEGNISIRDHKH